MNLRTLNAAISRRSRRAWLRLGGGLRSVVGERYGIFRKRLIGPLAAAVDEDKLSLLLREQFVPLSLISSDHDAPELHLAAADRLLRNEFVQGADQTVTFGRVVDWRYDPTDDPRRRWARDLNRFAWLYDLAAAAAHRDDERYATHAVDLLCAWIRDNPPPRDRDESHIAWNLMNVGLRATAWCECLPGLLAKGSIDPRSLLMILQSLHDHGEFLFRYKTHANHLLRESNGLLVLGGTLQFFERSELWRETATTRLAHEAKLQINDDGSHYELSPAYQWLVIEEFERTETLLNRFDLTLPGVDLQAKLKLLYRYLRGLRRPDGHWPLWGDGFVDDWPALSQRFERALERLDLSCQRSEGVLVLPDAGQAVLCREPGWLAFRAGAYGGAHGHEDALSVELQMGAVPVFVDPGSYTYNSGDDWRSYFVSSAAHNTLRVNGLSQVRRWFPDRSAARRGAPNSLVAGQLDDLDWVSADYAGGYGEFRFYPPEDSDRDVHDFRHRRTILALPEAGWVLVDDVDLIGGTSAVEPTEAALVEARFQLGSAVSAREISDAWHLGVEGRQLLWVIPPADARRCILIGQESPPAGWTTEGGQGAKQAAPQLSFSLRGQGRLRMVTALLPGWYGVDAAPPECVVELEGDVVSLALQLPAGVWRRSVRLARLPGGDAAFSVELA